MQKQFSGPSYYNLYVLSHSQILQEVDWTITLWRKRYSLDWDVTCQKTVPSWEKSQVWQGNSTPWEYLSFHAALNIFGPRSTAE